MWDLTLWWEWLSFAARWTHVITAIAWIGSSFYFIALDLGLNRDIPGPADGEEWQVHGGGFYHIQKYLVAPARMPEHLTWFKWESYATWLSGFALLMVVYWAGGELYLIDQSKADLDVYEGVVLSAAVLGGGWLFYNGLCTSPLAERPTLLMVILFLFLVVLGWGLNQVFTGRAMMLHLGAFTATIMSANVFFIIIPNQKIVVADLQAGHKPDPKYGKIAKLRSTHNNYLTLPVIFLMLSNHYPLAFASQYNWLIAALVFLMGVTIRHYFNTMHAKAGDPRWTWIVTVLLFISAVLLSMAGREREGDQAFALKGAAQTLAQTQGFADVHEIVSTNCSMCHARAPSYDGIGRAPKGILLETPEDVARNGRAIFLQAGVTQAMPPANLTYMDAEARAAIRAWYRAADLQGLGRL
ncbi:urate hydroxylase PuuD [Epibacterium ulvae]|uniref:urate hydroxylase PuuD n=1 Tax=Epibacterium ulvae TaxID=1156985 RepID=UPI001BFC3FAB|nr:urate hydroxylase PuuD [Epibacterium ulvae]MBT8153944.1 urate hydroxylase PuuD [Epibacterium ulvae]